MDVMDAAPRPCHSPNASRNWCKFPATWGHQQLVPTCTSLSLSSICQQFRNQDHNGPSALRFPTFIFPFFFFFSFLFLALPDRKRWLWGDACGAAEGQVTLGFETGCSSRSWLMLRLGTGTPEHLWSQVCTQLLQGNVQWQTRRSTGSTWC